jgi:hypothetical protein
MQHLRSVQSVAAGFAVVVVLSVATDFVLERSGVMPTGALYDTGLLLLALAYRSAYAVVGGYVAARLAPHHRLRHAVILGWIGTAVALLAALATWNLELGPGWYALALVATALPCTWYGGRLSERRQPHTHAARA